MRGAKAAFKAGEDSFLRLAGWILGPDVDRAMGAASPISSLRRFKSLVIPGTWPAFETSESTVKTGVLGLFFLSYGELDISCFDRHILF